ncbi:VanZ family protein [Puia sp.]|jgi:VanZ family protein|uniref:VanZ family protein n=1 Tax=Puia sp. TaxID=2045100 RepID=UPI002F42442E
MFNFIKKYLSAVYVPVIWTLLIAIAMCIPGSLIPNENKFAIPGFDKLVHLGLFGGFVFLWCLYLTTRRVSFGKLLLGFFCFYMLSNGFGIAMEYVQKYWIPGRDYDLGDIIADMFGAGLGYGLSNLLLLPGRKDKNG